jgi:hypothetical protein
VGDEVWLPSGAEEVDQRRIVERRFAEAARTAVGRRAGPRPQEQLVGVGETDEAQIGTTAKAAKAADRGRRRGRRHQGERIPLEVDLQEALRGASGVDEEHASVGGVGEGEAGIATLDA